MRLPKYNLFNISGMINVLLGAYLLGYLKSKGIDTFVAVFIMLAFQLGYIILYENLRIELKLKEKNETENSN